MHKEMFQHMMRHRVRLSPMAEEFDESGLKRPSRDIIWVVQGLDDMGLRLYNETTSHSFTLAYDNIREPPISDTTVMDGFSHSFLTLRVRVWLQGDRVNIDPL